MLFLSFRNLGKEFLGHPQKFVRCFNGSKTFSTKQDKKDNLDELYAKFSKTDSKSLLKKHLKPEIVKELKDVNTKTFNSTLLDCVQSGLKNPDSHVGIYSPDPEAYKCFSAIFNPIISDYHSGFKPTDKHPPSNFGDLSDMENLDPDCKYIISTRVRCGRSVKGYPFNPKLTEEEYEQLEKCIVSALQKLPAELSGKYEDLCNMTPERQKELIESHFLFKEGDRFLQDAMANRFWPKGRGIFLNKDQNFLVWVNEEDHMRIISMQKGGALGEVYGRMVKGVQEIGKHIEFNHDERLGFLTFCPTNLGTTIRASVHIALPNIAANREELEATASEHNLQVRGTAGEHTESEGGVYDVSNKRRLGLTECEAVMEMAKGILALIELEKKSEEKAKSKKCFEGSVFNSQYEEKNQKKNQKKSPKKK